LGNPAGGRYAVGMNQQILSTGFLLVVALIMLGYRTQAALIKKNVPMVKKERVRPLGMEFTEPIIELWVVALLLWNEISTDPLHLLVGIIGIIPGLFVGIFRARVMFVRAIPEYKAVVMRRSWIETVLVLAIIAVKLVTEFLPNSVYWLSLVITLLLVATVAESFTRVIRTVFLYRADVAEQASSK
jgi:hypothetical protein